MSEAEEIKLELEQAFPETACAFRVQRERRLWLEVEYARFAEVLRFAYERLAFRSICTITGLDEGPDLAFIYHLARESGTMLNLRTKRPKGEPFATVSALFPGAAIYEREIVDLFGATVSGLPEGPRYPLPDDWPAGEYPLRKDWRKPGAPAPEGGVPPAGGAEAGGAALEEGSNG